MGSHYELLGVDSSASADELRRARNRLLKQWHPDVAADPQRAEEMCRRINAAYETLVDPAQRGEYDGALGEPDPDIPAAFERAYVGVALTRNQLAALLWARWRTTQPHCFTGARFLDAGTARLVPRRDARALERLGLVELATQPNGDVAVTRTLRGHGLVMKHQRGEYERARFGRYRYC